ncbi:MAG: hypothetical protein IPN34_08800 [Planctomycetes bacterium]|nr:hypothetical protein [Planctomycetota bacterium]
MRTLAVYLRAFLAAAVVPCLAAELPGQSPSLRASVGVWPWLTSTNLDTDAPNIVAKAVAEDLDEIYIHVYSSTAIGAGDLRIVDEAGSWNPTWGALRPLVTLSRFTALAHAQNLRVYAVLNCFYETTPTPDSVAHRDYLAFDVIDYLLNSFDAQGRDVYGLDGIALDRVRYYSGPRTHHNVTDFLTKVRSVAGAKEVHAFVPANAYVMDGPTYDARFNSYAQAMATIENDFGLHYPTVAPLLDVMLPMAYTSDGHVYGSNYTNMEAYVGICARYLQLAAQNGGSPQTQIVPAIRAWNDSSGTTTPASITASVRGALRNGGVGFNVFRYYTSVNQPTWWAAMAPYIAPRSNAPAARMQARFDGLTLEADLSTSTDLDEPLANLRFRLDLGANGSFDTASTAQPRPFVLFDAPTNVTVAAEVADSTGLVDTVQARVAAAQPLSLSQAWLFAGAGGAIDLRFRGGRGASGHFGLFLLSASGYAPGTPIGGLPLPLNWDPLTELALVFANTPPFTGFFAPLGANGEATARLALPAGAIPPAMIGLRIHSAVLGLEGATLSPRFVSNAAGFFILP